MTTTDNVSVDLFIPDKVKNVSHCSTHHLAVTIPQVDPTHSPTAMLDSTFLEVGGHLNSPLSQRESLDMTVEDESTPSTSGNLLTSNNNTLSG